MGQQWVVPTFGHPLDTIENATNIRHHLRNLERAIANYGQSATPEDRSALIDEILTIRDVINDITDRYQG